jgi:hypothetical protein
MQEKKDFFNKLYSKLLSEKTKENGERAIVIIAIISFVIHLLLIALANLHIIQINYPKLLSNPVAAIYTPFSFILIYEVYLLVYYLPKSITSYIGKQYEIITLIIIRRNFKDLGELKFTTNWFNEPGDLQFTYDIMATIALFIMIYLFYRLNQIRIENKPNKKTDLSPDILKFIKTKKIIAAILVPILLILAVYSFSHWIIESLFILNHSVEPISDVNKIFYVEFFTILILADVFLLLFSFINTDEFYKVIRNSGFVISTILIKLSFDAEGILNIILIISAVLFGVIILAIHNLYEKSSFTNVGETADSESEKNILANDEEII